jgi:hypothetical protein
VKLALSWVLLVALVIHVGAHVAIAIGLLQKRAWVRAIIALFVPPLAPVWGWREGMRVRVYTWAAALATYAIAVTVAA